MSDLSFVGGQPREAIASRGCSTKKNQGSLRLGRRPEPRSQSAKSASSLLKSALGLAVALHVGPPAVYILGDGTTPISMRVSLPGEWYTRIVAV